MKKKLMLAAGIMVLISVGKTFSQSWNLTGNAGTSAATNFIGTTDAKVLKIKTNNAVRIFIKSTGEVGIGTSFPAAKLDVNGTVKMSSLLVNRATPATGYIASIGGKLIAEEVRVDLQAAWPDYVFSNSHTLMPLDELEQFLTENKHLPGVPVAEEVKSNGIMLGEMQTKSMEKIEESMLYILQLNKENHQLKAQIDNLQQQINDLKK
ncbi:MAG: hypothetical protein ABIT08_10685 [Bacteroidia bacterium]